jgi:1-deoxy-D-xylulose-5-phosphate synthase
LKGKGYAPAIAHKEQFHWGMPFDLATGDPLDTTPSEDYADVFADHMLELMKKDSKVAVITAGTPGVLGFYPEKRQIAGRQFIDVGIAEQDAVALASGMAKAGVRPCFGVVSSFLQRAYDQLSQDVAINSTPVCMTVLYASVLEMTDVTHLGWFDIPFIANIPGWVYLAPTCKEEYLAMIDWAMTQQQYPVAVRTPGGRVITTGETFPTDYSDINKYAVTHRGSKVALIGAGTFYGMAQQTAELLKESGIDATVINPRFLTGVDTELLDNLKSDHQLVITLEDGVLDGGFGEKIARYYGPTEVKVKCYGLAKQFLDRYNARELMEASRLNPELIKEDILAAL